MDNMASSGTENSQDSVSLRQEDTVSLVRSIISSEFRDLKKQLIEKPSNSLKRKIVDDKRVSFKYNGNQKQYDFNCSVIQKLGNIKCILEDSTLEDIESETDKVLSDVQGRNKLIKVADRTESGWTTVDEYEKSDYADDSEDDKTYDKPTLERFRRNFVCTIDHRRWRYLAILTGVILFVAYRGTGQQDNSTFAFGADSGGHFRRDCRAQIPNGMSQEVPVPQFI